MRLLMKISHMMTITTQNPGKILWLLIALSIVPFHRSRVWHFYQFFKKNKTRFQQLSLVRLQLLLDIICRMRNCRIVFIIRSSCSQGWENAMKNGLKMKESSHVNHSAASSTGCISSSQLLRYNEICKWIFDANKIPSCLPTEEWNLSRDSRLGSLSKSACIIKLSGTSSYVVVIVFET